MGRCSLSACCPFVFVALRGSRHPEASPAKETGGNQDPQASQAKDRQRTKLSAVLANKSAAVSGRDAGHRQRDYARNARRIALHESPRRSLLSSRAPESAASS